MSEIYRYKKVETTQNEKNKKMNYNTEIEFAHDNPSKHKTSFLRFADTSSLLLNLVFINKKTRISDTIILFPVFYFGSHVTSKGYLSKHCVGTSLVSISRRLVFPNRK